MRVSLHDIVHSEKEWRVDLVWSRHDLLTPLIAPSLLSVRTYGRHDNEPLSTAQIANRANIVKKYLNSNLKAMEKVRSNDFLIVGFS